METEEAIRRTKGCRAAMEYRKKCEEEQNGSWIGVEERGVVDWGNEVVRREGQENGVMEREG